MDTQERSLLSARGAVDAYVRARTDHDVEDVVQEAMTRLLENRARLDPDAWATYAVVCAGNLLRERARVGDVARRHAHRLHEPDLTPDPEQEVLTAEEHAAMRQALDDLAPPDAAMLVDHYERPDRLRSTAPATAARLARLRAKLRVSYVLAHARVELPTQRCRPVLEALSTGDQRRQHRLGAARHLRACTTCATCAPALVQRQRALAALNPLAWAAIGAGAAWAAVRRHPGRSTATAGTVAALALAGGMALSSSSAPAPAGDDAPTRARPAADSTPLRIGGEPVFPLSAGSVPVGPAAARDLLVQDVAADEGFWVGTGPGQRLWVVLEGPAESPVTIRAGDRVSFTGVARRPEPGHAEAIGLTADEGSGELDTTGVLIDVSPDDLVVEAP